MNFLTKIISFLAVFGFLKATTANTVKTCHKCEGINCQRTTLSETQKCSDLLDYCVTVFKNFNVIRKGCSSEVPIELRRRCDMNTVECHKCNTDRCNNLGQANFICLTCDSTKDANCANNPQMVSPTRCAAPTAPNSYCYVKYENNITKRGCSLTVADQQKCYNEANCMLCLPGDIKGCNSVDFKPGTRAKRF